VTNIITFIGYFLNPLFQFSETIQDDPEVLSALNNVIERLQPNMILQIKAEREVNFYIVVCFTIV
jgi:hypothetical protein